MQMNMLLADFSEYSLNSIFLLMEKYIDSIFIWGKDK